MLAPLLIVLLVAAMSGGVGTAAAGNTCSGDATVELTVTDPDNDGAGETSVDSAIPAGCDIALRTDGRTAKFWSMRVFDAGDASKLYFCQDGTDPPPGESACTSVQPDFPPDADVLGGIVKENVVWRLYVHVNHRQASLNLAVRVHYGWKGTGDETDECPAEPGTGPCEQEPPICETAPTSQECLNPGKYDLAVRHSVPKVGPRDRSFEATLTVENTDKAAARSPASHAGLSFFPPFAGKYTQLDSAGIKLVDPADIDVCDSKFLAFGIICDFPPLDPGESRTYRFSVPVGGEVFSVNGTVAPRKEPLCVTAEEITCTNNTSKTTVLQIPAPETNVEQPNLSETGEIFFKGRSEPSDASVAAARAAARGPKVKRVEIAVVRTRGKARAAAAGCLWLRSRDAKFKRAKPGEKRLCVDPVWLKADGTTRWRFRGTKPLPQGAYVIYARAFDAAGHVTNVFTAKNGNRRAFKVG